jgi:hypothetical protein
LPPSTRAGSTNSAGATIAPSGTSTGAATTSKSGGGIVSSIGAAASSAINKGDGLRAVDDVRGVLATGVGSWIITVLYWLI